jgi:hypothetical protein
MAALFRQDSSFAEIGASFEEEKGRAICVMPFPGEGRGPASVIDKREPVLQVRPWTPAFAGEPVTA